MIFTLFVLSALLSYAILKFLISNAETIGLVDQSNGRKIHKGAIPSMGGLALVMSILCLLSVAMNQFLTFEVGFVLLSVLVLGGLSFVDDLIDLNYKIRLLVQFAVVSGAWGVGFRIEDLHGFLGLSHLNEVVSYFTTVVFCMGLINAYNLIDGIDGLLGGVSLISFSVIGYAFFLTQQVFYYSLCTVIVGFLISFIYFNRNPARIFMGDTGSMVVGFLLAILGVKLFNSSPLGWDGVNFSAGVLAIHVIPAYDMVRVMAGRLLKRTSVFHADKTHVHHIFLGMGLSTKTVSGLVIGCHLLMVSLALLIPNLSLTWLILINLMVFAAICEVPLWVKAVQYKIERSKLAEKQVEMIQENRFLSNF